jgi:hypothetical protein
MLARASMRLADFLRLYPLRAPNIMWFLGAGASAAAGVPTAEEMVWDFKRSLYCSALRVPLASCSDLGDPSLRSILQKHFDSSGKFPAVGAAEEYAFYFEAAYPDAADRRRYIEGQIAKAHPSYGHLALAALLKLDKARIVWTVNFERTIEDAAFGLFRTTAKVTVVTLENAAVGRQALQEGRWPIILKPHGDFQSRHLKNTGTELQKQDEELRRLLVDSSTRQGLAVIGYSGRDFSVMDALTEAVDSKGSYPFGLFWFCRRGQLRPEAEALLEKAKSRGLDAHRIEIETFDETLGDILHQVPDVPEEIIEALRSTRPRLSDAPIPKPGNDWPVARTNAVPVISSPIVCRRIECNIGGAQEVEDAVMNANASVIATRRNVGVLAFGSDSEVRSVFEPFGITTFDLYSIEPKRLRYDSVERRLISEALVRGICRARPLIGERKKAARFLTVDPARESGVEFSGLRQLTDSITGAVPSVGLQWREAAEVRLEWRLGQLWFLLLPTVWVEATDDRSREAARAEFVRERTATRYNRVWNSLLDVWTEIISGGMEQGSFHCFGISDGIDAAFTLSRITAFSRPERRK